MFHAGFSPLLSKHYLTSMDAFNQCASSINKSITGMVQH